MALQQILELQDRMQQSIIGQERVIERLLLALLCNGNVLVEGLPGLAKTRAVKSLADNLEARFRRIQFTPDLLPADITGTEIFYQGSDSTEFRFEPGPIFANIVLGDEINRAPAKVQAALLEAMEEHQVTVAGKTHSLPPLFMVMATQNPIEHEGTYPLPEAQRDRFLMQVNIAYPSVEDEVRVIELVRSEEPSNSESPSAIPMTESASTPHKPRISQQSIFSARQEIRNIHVSEALARYMADLVYASRTPARFSEELGRWLEVGASPRASLALDRCSRAHAWLHRRDYVDPEDVQEVAHDVLRHRLILSYQAQGEGITPDQVTDSLLQQVALP